jgi:GcrA cell cycle regulator
MKLSRTAAAQLNASIRELAATGMSYNNIAKQLRVTKNTVCGRAHRLDLPQRGSPIKPKIGEQPKPARAPGRSATPKSTLPPIEPYNRIASPFGAKAVVDVARVAQTQKSVSYQAKQCCWPIGDPKRGSFRFCNDVTEGGKIYCGDHNAIAYVRRVA